MLIFRFLYSLLLTFPLTKSISSFFIINSNNFCLLRIILKFNNEEISLYDIRPNNPS